MTSSMPRASALASALAVVAICALPAAASAAELPAGNLVVNGGFEQPQINASWTIVQSMPGWTSPNNCEYEIWRTQASPAEGAQSLELDSNNCADVLSQTIATTAGVMYEVRFWLAARATNEADNGVRLTFGSIDRSVRTANMAWVSYSYRGLATAASTTLRIEDIGSNNGFGTRLDAVSVIKDSDGDGVRRCHRQLPQRCEPQPDRHRR